MRILLTAALLAVCVAGVRAGDQPADPTHFTGPISDKSYICMMKDSMQPKAGIPHDHEGKRYWFCCDMCIQSFQETPDAIALAKDPVDGKTVDKATAPAYALKGKAFYFSSEKTLKTFSENPARYVSGS